MRNVFDKGFIFAIKLDNLFKNKNFLEKKLENLNEIEIYFNEITELANSFLNLVKFFLKN